MLESPAWRVLSLSAHRVLYRVVIELRHHGGHEGDGLCVTYADFETYGIERHAIAQYRDTTPAPAVTPSMR
jgi:hypothetical protein